MSWVIASVVVLAVLIVVLVWAWRRAQAAAAGGPPRQAWDDAGAPGARLVLDVGAGDPDHPSVQRLVHETARRALLADPTLDHVEVVDPGGRMLGREARPRPLPAEVALPESLREPHGRRRHAPSPVGHDDDPPTGPVHELAPEVARLALADRLDLTPGIRSRIVDPERAVDVVRAILEVAGRPVEVDGDLLVTGDVAIAVVDTRTDADRALTHGFLRIQGTAAPRGIVLRLGYADPAVVRRRETTARHVRYVGPDALQRMADAVAAGGDPIAFAAGPAIVR